MAGKKRAMDMTNGGLVKKILLFALPIAATSILQQLFNAADVAIVGRFVGANAMAAVGANTSIVNLLVNFMVGISLGSNVVIANAIGKGDETKVHKAVHTSVIIAFLAGCLFIVIGEVFAEPVMALTKVPEEVLAMATLYLRIYMAGMPVIVLYNFEAAILRSIGDTRTPLITLAFSGVLNVCLNIMFVVVFGMTVDGVALATVLSNVLSCVVLFVVLCRSKDVIRIIPKQMRIHGDVLKEILKIGVPSGLQTSIFSLANIVIQSAINSLGATIMAGNSAAFNVEVMTFFVMSSFTQACTTFVGQNNGAGKPDRCVKVLKICLLEAAIGVAIVISLILPNSTPLLSLFNSDPAVIAAGYERFIYICPTFFLTLQYDIVAGYLRGYGISTVPSVVTICGIVVTRLVIILGVFPHIRTYKCIMMAYPISLGLTAALMWILVVILRPARKRRQELAAEKNEAIA